MLSSSLHLRVAQFAPTGHRRAVAAWASLLSAVTLRPMALLGRVSEKQFFVAAGMTAGTEELILEGV